MTFKKTKDIEALQYLAQMTRLKIIKMLAAAGSGHPGGSLSSVEILTSLYFSVINHDPPNPQWEDRDRFVLSKGHGAPALYAVLAACGYFPAWHLEKLRTFGSILQGHPDMHSTPGIDMSSGSLGQGLSAACGMACAAKMDGKTVRVYCLIGDGESQEGQIWEALMCAAHYKLDNLCIIIDHNKLQIDGAVKQIMDIGDMESKLRAFGFETQAVNGHDFKELLNAFEKAASVKGRPCAILAHTIKGKGVSFMEGKVEFHGRAPTTQETCDALGELGDKES